MTAYQITLRDRESQTVVGYYIGSWTTDRCRAVTIRKREAAEATPRGCAINARVTLTSLRSRRSPPPTTSI